MAEVNIAEDDWSEWNPMARDYYDELFNKYETGPGAGLLAGGAISQDQAKLQREINQSKYPFLVIRKKDKYVTETMLRNLFGEGLICNVEYRNKSRVYLVYFHNIASIESALSKLQQFPLKLEYYVGKPRLIKSGSPFEVKQPDEAVPVVEETKPSLTLTTVSNDVDYISRTIRLSGDNHKHPEFCKTPLIIKADYGNKDTLLYKNDPTYRYLNVKFNFVLEQHGAYKTREKSEIDNCVNIYRHGRILTVPEIDGDEILVSRSGNLMQGHLRKCVSCALLTDSSCKYCSMPFCDSRCFKKVTDEHNMNCVSGSNWWKRMYEKGTIKSEFVNWQLPPNGCAVKITAFEQTNILYIRSANVEDEQVYFNVISEIMISGAAMPRLQELPCPGTIVLYKFERQLVRAMVLNTDSPLTIYVVCVDFGNIEITMLQQLYECSEELAALPRLAIPVLLRGVPRRYMYPNVRHLLYTTAYSFDIYQLKYCDHEFDFSRGMQRVVLTENEKNCSLNRILKTMLTPSEPTVSHISYTEDYLMHVDVKTGKYIDMVVMDNSFCQYGIIYCTILDYACEITQMESDLQAYGETKWKFTSFAPPKHELCIAKYNGKWCRGVSVELVGDGYPSILFFDYGNIAPVHVNDILPYPPQFTFPILTTEFEVLDIPANPGVKLTARIKELLPVGAILNFDEVIFNQEENNYSLRYDKISLLIKESK